MSTLKICRLTLLSSKNLQPNTKSNHPISKKIHCKDPIKLPWPMDSFKTIHSKLTMKKEDSTIQLSTLLIDSLKGPA
jgi:hypothetical protein